MTLKTQTETTFTTGSTRLIRFRFGFFCNGAESVRYFDHRGAQQLSFSIKTNLTYQDFPTYAISYWKPRSSNVSHLRQSGTLCAEFPPSCARYWKEYRGASYAWSQRFLPVTISKQFVKEIGRYFHPVVPVCWQAKGTVPTMKAMISSIEQRLLSFYEWC